MIQIKKCFVRTPQDFLRHGAGVLPALIAVSVPLVITGCGGSGSSTPSVSTAPTSDQAAAAATTTADSVTTTAAVMEPLTYLSESDTTRSRQTDPTRPAITVDRSGTNGVTVTINFGTGITGAGGVTRSGIVKVAYDRSVRTGTVSFVNYAVNGKNANGSVSLSQLTISDQQVSFTAALDLSITNVTTIKGNVSAVLSPGLVSFPSGSIAVQPAGSSGYSATLTGIALSPSTYQNLVPYAGVVTTPYPFANFTATVAVTFSAQSPVTGVVQVSVNGSASTPYTLASFR